MEVITSVESMEQKVKELKDSNQRIGFVPTMGYFHEGHLSLMDYSVEENHVTVVSVFVNPIQFDPGEDLDVYPRDLERDKDMAKRRNVDIMFCPKAESMYPENFRTNVSVKDLTEGLCGASRPGHFDGVTTVVTKLFNIVQPDKAYFGRKDYQQLMVIKQMVKDLNIPVEVVGCPIVREADGLAVSSRNVNLKSKEREAAKILNKSLEYAKEQIDAGERDPDKILLLIKDKIRSEPLAAIDYVEIVNGDDFKKIDRIEGKVLIALAVKIGQTRLIDNMLLTLADKE